MCCQTIFHGAPGQQMFPPPGSRFAFAALEVLAARLTLQIHSSEPFDFISFRIVGLAVGGDRTMDTCANLTHVYLTPRTTCILNQLSRVHCTTCTRLPSTCSWFYLTGLHLSPPSHVTVYSTFGQFLLHMATLHHTTFSPNICSIITSAFRRTTSQINATL
jgi:hypothetical protein